MQDSSARTLPTSFQSCGLCCVAGSPGWARDGARTPCCRCSVLAVGTKTPLPAPAPAPRARAGKEMGTLWRGTWCRAETWGTWALPLQCPHQHQPLLLPHPHVAVVTRNRRQREGHSVRWGAAVGTPGGGSGAGVQLLGCSGSMSPKDRSLPHGRFSLKPLYNRSESRLGGV